MLTKEKLDAFIDGFKDNPVLHEVLLNLYRIDNETSMQGFEKGIALNISPYRDIEALLCSQVSELKLHHLKLIFNNEYSYLFQDGMPHISWNTDRYELIKSYIKSPNLKIVGKTLVSETWNDVTYTYYHNTVEDFYIKVTNSEPRTFGGGSRSSIKLEVIDKDKVSFYDDYMLVHIETDGATKAYIVQEGGYHNYMFTGTYQECQDRATELRLTPNQFLIVNLKLVRQSKGN